MGIEYYVGCHRCKVRLHLGKWLYPVALADFMESHLGHDCMVSVDLSDDFANRTGIFEYETMKKAGRRTRP